MEAPRPQPFISPHCGDSPFLRSMLGGWRASVSVPAIVSPEALPPQKSGGCEGSWTPREQPGPVSVPALPTRDGEGLFWGRDPLGQSHVRVAPLLPPNLAPDGQAPWGVPGVRWHGGGPSLLPVLLQLAFLLVEGVPWAKSPLHTSGEPHTGRKVTRQSTEPAPQRRQAVSKGAPNRSPLPPHRPHRPHYPHGGR